MQMTGKSSKFKLVNLGHTNVVSCFSRLDWVSFLPHVYGHPDRPSQIFPEKLEYVWKPLICIDMILNWVVNIEHSVLFRWYSSNTAAHDSNYFNYYQTLGVSMYHTICMIVSIFMVSWAAGAFITIYAMLTCGTFNISPNIRERFI